MNIYTGPGMLVFGLLELKVKLILIEHQKIYIRSNCNVQYMQLNVRL